MEVLIMSKRMFNFIVGVSGGVAAIASAVVTYFQPAYATAIVGAIGIAETAAVEICSLFVVKE